MMNTRVLTRENVKAVLAMEAALPAIEQAFVAHSEGRTQMPSKVYIELKEHAGDFRAMPSYLDGAAGVKWVNSHPLNFERHGLPTVMGVYILSDPVTALPLAIMDATLMTAMRTGAAAGIASKYLAPKPPRSIGLIGCGVQAHVLLEAHRILFEGLEVLVYDRDEEKSRAFADVFGARVVSLEDACGASIVCTQTPSKKPFVRSVWIKPGTHINAIGADAHGKQEIEVDVLRNAKVFLDDWDQAMGSGEVNVPLSKGEISRDSIYGTLGDVAAGSLLGREGDEITLFDSTGLAIQDLALARLIFERAKDQGVGLDVPLMGLT